MADSLLMVCIILWNAHILKIKKKIQWTTFWSAYLIFHYCVICFYFEYGFYNIAYNYKSIKILLFSQYSVKATIYLEWILVFIKVNCHLGHLLSFLHIFGTPCFCFGFYERNMLMKYGILFVIWPVLWLTLC